MKHNITVQSLLKEKKNAFMSESTVSKMNAEIARLQAENAAANKRIEELFKEKQELERKYNLLRYGSED